MNSSWIIHDFFAGAFFRLDYKERGPKTSMGGLRMCWLMSFFPSTLWREDQRQGGEIEGCTGWWVLLLRGVSSHQHYEEKTKDKEGRSKDALVDEDCCWGEFLPFKRTIYNKGRTGDDSEVHCLRTLEFEDLPLEEGWRYLEENITTAMNKGRVYDINEYAAAIDTKMPVSY